MHEVNDIDEIALDTLVSATDSYIVSYVCKHYQLPQQAAITTIITTVTVTVYEQEPIASVSVLTQLPVTFVYIGQPPSSPPSPVPPVALQGTKRLDHDSDTQCTSSAATDTFTPWPTVCQLM